MYCDLVPAMDLVFSPIFSSSTNRKKRAKQLAIHGSVLKPSRLKNIAAQLQSAAVSVFV